MSGIIIDIIIIMICLITTYIGYRRGLTYVLYGIISFVISLVIMVILSEPISNAIIKNTQIDENIATTINNLLPKSIISQEGQVVANTNFAIINEYISEAISKAESNITGYVSVQLSYLFVKVGTMIVLFIVCRIVLVIIKFATNVITSLPVIGSFDRLGGLIYGALKSLIIVYVCLALLSVASPVISSWGIIQAINNSHLGKLMYNNNVILNLIVQ